MRPRSPLAARAVRITAALLPQAILALGLPLRADEVAPAPPNGEPLAGEQLIGEPLDDEPVIGDSLNGEEEVRSLISPVDACNRAQGLRPAGTTVTTMHYARILEDGERLFRCRVSWSDAEDARPTGRPILFGPTP